MNGLTLQTPRDVLLACAQRAKELRLSENMTQKELADRMGISVGSIKRFEKTGEIQFSSLLNLALVLGRLDEFDAVFTRVRTPVSLFNHKEPPKRQRARKK